MSIDIKIVCPLGSKCEEAKDGALHRCAWYIELHGTNPNTGEPVKEWLCSMAAQPMLLIENSQQQRSTGAAVESFRNAMVEGNIRMQNAMQAAISKDNVPTIREIN